MFEYIVRGRRVFMWAFAIVILTLACNEPTELGSELITPEDVFFKDNWDITATTELDDSLVVYNLASQRVTTLLCGDVEDPVFGNYSAQLFARLFPLSLSRDLADATIDSVVLSLAYHPAVDTYGDERELHSVEVFVIDELLETSRTYYATDTIAIRPNSIGEKIDFRPDTAIRPMILELDPQEDGSDTIEFEPHLRIPLNTGYWQNFWSDTTNYLDDSTFLSNFPGICVRPKSTSGGMMHFSMPNEFTRITVYYNYGDTTFNHLNLIADDLASVRFSTFDNHDYVGSSLENFIGNPALSDSLLFVQSMKGVSAKINIPEVVDLQDFIINHAILELFTLELPGDDTLLYQTPDILAASFVTDDDLVWTDDLQAAVSRGNLRLFGGTVIDTLDVNGMMVRGYKMNVSNHFQDMAFGEAPPSLFIETFLETIRVNRVVLAGPDHPEYPIRLKVTYSSN